MADDDLTLPIVAALQAGDLQSAENQCRIVLERIPDEPDVLLLMGLSLQRLRRPQDALGPFARLVELYPEDGMHWNNYATALRLAGDFEAAAQTAETAVRYSPHDPDRLEQLGLLKLQTNKPAEARAALMLAHELAPDSTRIRLHAARACIVCRDHRADELLQPWREWLPIEEDLKAELADLLVQVGQAPGAMELLEDMLERAPDDWSSQLLLAKVYERLNRLDQARARLQWIIASAPSNGDPAIPYEIKIQQAQLAMRESRYMDARALLEDVGPGDDTDDGHFFALAKACDRINDIPASMRALETAHRIQVGELHASNPDLLEPDAPLLPHVDDRVSEQEYRSWPVLKAPDASQSPVFVVGFPRSGTTLLEQMLDAHPRLQSMDERPFLNRLANQLENIEIRVPDDLKKLSQRDCDELRKGYLILACGKVARRWDARLVDKNPLNMLWLPMIRRMFPEAKFILALRHPCDVIVSCYLQNFRAAPLVAACSSLERIARAYVASMQNWLHHVSVFQPDVFVSRYEDLVAQTQAQTRNIAGFLGLDEAGSMLQFAERAQDKGYIATPSYTQVVEPINTGAVGHWQKYADYLEPVLPVLRPMLNYWGYACDVAEAKQVVEPRGD